MKELQIARCGTRRWFLRSGARRWTHGEGTPAIIVGNVGLIVPKMFFPPFSRCWIRTDMPHRVALPAVYLSDNRPLYFEEGRMLPTSELDVARGRFLDLEEEERRIRFWRAHR